MSLSRVRLFVNPWTVAYQVPPSVGFSRQEYWRGLPFPSPDLPNPGIEPRSPALYADALPSEPPGKFLFDKYFCCMTRINAAFQPKIELSWSVLLSFGHLCVLSRFSCVWLFTTLWTVAHQASLSVGFFRQENWIDALLSKACPPPGDLPWHRGQTHVSYVSCIGRWILYH